MRGFKYVTILVVLGLFLVPMASAADLSAEYFHGRWVVNEQSCSSPTSEYLKFNKNGTFEETRSGKADVIGFWKLDGDNMKLNMLSSAASFQDLHKDLAKFEGIYNHFEGQMLIFNTKKKSFEAYGVVANEVKRATAVRCP